jgi:hypothetical protein
MGDTHTNNCSVISTQVGCHKLLQSCTGVLAYQVAGTEETVAKSRAEGNFVEQLDCFDLYDTKYIYFHCADCVGKIKLLLKTYLGLQRSQIQLKSENIVIQFPRFEGRLSGNICKFWQSSIPTE